MINGVHNTLRMHTTKKQDLWSSHGNARGAFKSSGLNVHVCRSLCRFSNELVGCQLIAHPVPHELNASRRSSEGHLEAWTTRWVNPRETRHRSRRRRPTQTDLSNDWLDWRGRSMEYYKIQQEQICCRSMLHRILFGEFGQLLPLTSRLIGEQRQQHHLEVSTIVKTLFFS